MYRRVLYVGVAVWVVLLSVTAVLAAPRAASPFADAPQGLSWWLETAEYFRDEGIVEGYADGTFRPGQSINRAEMAKVVVGFVRQFLDKELPLSSPRPVFTDVSVGEWFAPFVQTGVDKKLFAGYANGITYGPGDFLTRAQAVKVMVEIARSMQVYPTSSVPITFTDTVSSAWYAPYLLDGVGYAMIEGYPDGTFRPDASVSRAEFVVMLNRTLVRILDGQAITPVPEKEQEEAIPEEETDSDEVSRQFESYLELHPFATQQASVPAGATNIPYVHAAVVIKKEPVLLRSFAAKRDGLGDPKDFDSFTLHLDGRRIASAVSIDLHTQMVQFQFSEGVRLDKGTYTLELRGHLKPDAQAGGEHRFTILENLIEVTTLDGNAIPMEGAYPVYGAFWKTEARLVPTVEVLSGVRPVQEFTAGATNTPFTGFQIKATDSVLVRGVQIALTGTAKDVREMTAWDSETGELLAYPTEFTPEGTLFLDFTETPEGGLFVLDGAVKQIELRGTIGDVVGKTIGFTIQETTDIYVVEPQTTIGARISVSAEMDPVPVVAALPRVLTLQGSDRTFMGMTTIGRIDVAQGQVLSEGELRVRLPYHRKAGGNFSGVTQMVLFDDAGVARVRKDVRPDTNGDLIIPLQGVSLDQKRYHIALNVPHEKQLPEWFFVELAHKNNLQERLVGTVSLLRYRVVPAMPVFSGTREIPLAHLWLHNTSNMTIELTRTTFRFDAKAPKQGKDFTNIQLRQFGKPGDWSLTPSGDIVTFQPNGFRIGPGERVYLTIMGKPLRGDGTAGRLHLVPSESEYTLGGEKKYFGRGFFTAQGGQDTNTSAQVELASDATLLGSFSLRATYDQLMLERLIVSSVEPSVLQNIERLYLAHEGVILGTGQMPGGDNRITFTLGEGERLRIPQYEQVQVDVYVRFKNADDASISSTQHLALYLRDLRVRGSQGSLVHLWNRSSDQLTLVEETQSTFRVSGAKVRVGDVLYRTTGNVFEYATVTGVHTAYAQEGDLEGITIGMIKVERMVGASSGMALGTGVADILTGFRTGTTQVLSAPFTLRETPSWFPQEQGSPLFRSDRWSIDVMTAGDPNSTASVDARLQKLRLTVYGSARAKNFIMRSRHTGQVVATGHGSHEGTGASHIIFDLSAANPQDVILRPGSQRTYTFDADVEAPTAVGGSKASLTFSIASLGSIDSTTFGVDTDVVWQDTNYNANGGAGRTVDVYWVDTGSTSVHMTKANQYDAP